MMGIEYSVSPINPETGEPDPACIVTLTDDANPARFGVIGPGASIAEQAAGIAAFFADPPD